MAESVSSGLPLDALAPLYRLEELEGWHLLARHFEIVQGFSVVVVLAPDDWGVALVRERLPQILPEPGAVLRIRFDPDAPYFQLAEALLALQSLPATVRVLWIDADPGDPDTLPHREEAWQQALARLNRYRNTLQARFFCTLVLAGPVRLQAIMREAAPDLWSIRSAVVRIEPPGASRAVFEWLPPDERQLLGTSEMSDSGDPAVTLAEANKLRGKPGREVLLAILLQRAGNQARRRLDWDTAEQCLQEAFSLQANAGGDPELRWDVATDLAEVFHDLARYDRAEHYLSQALQTAEEHFGPTDSKTSVTLNNLAQLLKATNRLAEAEPLMRRALAIDQQSFGDQHPSVARDLNNLATLLQDTNRLAEAEPLMRRGLAIEENNRGKDHPYVAIQLNNLATLLQATNRLPEAEPLMRRALALDAQSFGDQHPNVALPLNNLALMLQNTNRLAEAEPLMRRALAIDEQSCGDQHPRVARDLNNLAQLLQATNRLAEADPLMRRALAIDEQSFGDQHPNVARDLYNLAMLLLYTKGLAEAEPLMRRAGEIFEASLGTNHPNTQTVAKNYRLLLEEMTK